MMDEYNLQWKPLVLTEDEKAFMESGKKAREEIVSALHVPYSVVGALSENYTAQQREDAFARVVREFIISRMLGERA